MGLQAGPRREEAAELNDGPLTAVQTAVELLRTREGSDASEE
jgi:hypothetical protein